jgi:hypothetical protein
MNQCLLEGLLECVNFRNSHRRKSGLHVFQSESLGFDYKPNILHVLGIFSSHHLCEDQVDWIWNKQLEEASARAQSGFDVLFPLGPAKHLVFLKNVCQVQTSGFQGFIQMLQRFPKLIIRFEPRNF